mgnify:CR=1 FL=1
MDFNEQHGGSLNELIAAESGIDFLTEPQITAILDVFNDE